MLIGYGMIAFLDPYHHRCEMKMTIGEKTEWGQGSEVLKTVVNIAS